VEAGESRSREGALVRGAARRAERPGIGEGLQPRERLRRLQERLYDKAKGEPATRFHFLYDKICREDVLTCAWERVRRNRGDPGVDGQTIEAVEAYGVKRWLGELREDLRAGRYEPKPVRRVMIRKPGGGERPLGIPAIRDRVVQTAALFVLQPVFEADFDEAT